MTASEAWALFGEGNGAANLAQMLARIAHYRRTPIAPGEDPLIGCVFIRDVCFFPPDESAPPPDFSANIVQGKSYDLSREPAATYFGDLIQRILGHAVDIDLAGPWNRQGPVFGDPRLALCVPKTCATWADAPQHAVGLVSRLAPGGRCRGPGVR
jgi:putative restriction endonuclease